MAKYRRRNTEERIAKLHREGRGQGHGKDYVPWIKIHDLSSLGRVHRPLSSKTGRVMHLLSDGENDLFLRLDASARVIDIREQFPLPRQATMLIAEELGYRHPAVHGVDVVMTTDMVVDLIGARRIAFSVKQAGEMVKPRVAEKLEIERLYWTRRGVEWVLMIEEKDRDARLNHQEIAEWRSVDGLVEGAAVWDQRGADLLVILADTVRGRLLDALKSAEAGYGWTPGTGISALKRLLAIGLVEHVGSGRLDVFGPVTQVAVADGAR